MRGSSEGLMVAFSTIFFVAVGVFFVLFVKSELIAYTAEFQENVNHAISFDTMQRVKSCLTFERGYARSIDLDLLETYSLSIPSSLFFQTDIISPLEVFCLIDDPSFNAEISVEGRKWGFVGIEKPLFGKEFASTTKIPVMLMDYEVKGKGDKVMKEGRAYVLWKDKVGNSEAIFLREGEENGEFVEIGKERLGDFLSKMEEGKLYGVKVKEDENKDEEYWIEGRDFEDNGKRVSGKIGDCIKKDFRCVVFIKKTAMEAGDLSVEI